MISTDLTMNVISKLHLECQCQLQQKIFKVTYYQGRGDPVLHIELRKWADLLVIAPLSANTLGKLSNGLADNLLTCVARAWDFSKPCLVAPAMNTYMWDHPVTKPSLDRLKEWGYVEIPCIEKVLMCKDKGKGAMAEPLTIVDFVVEALLPK